MHLRVEGIEFSYNSVKVLKGIKFEIRRGELVSILGTNGAGKTTLLKTINLILKPSKGVVYLNGKRLDRMSGKEIAKRMAYVPQYSQKNPVKVFDAVLLGRKPYIKWEISGEDIKRTEEVLKLLGLEKLAMRNMDQLSGGEFQKVMIARAIAQDPEILLLDEPMANLDLKNQMEVAELIKTITESKGISTIVVMHDLNLALRVSHRFIMIKDGKIFRAGGPEIITEDVIKKVYGIDAIIKELPELNLKVVIPVNGVKTWKNL